MAMTNLSEGGTRTLHLSEALAPEEHHLLSLFVVRHGENEGMAITSCLVVIHFVVIYRWMN